jgi:hypothetical protein
MADNVAVYHQSYETLEKLHVMLATGGQIYHNLTPLVKPYLKLSLLKNEYK